MFMFTFQLSASRAHNASARAHERASARGYAFRSLLVNPGADRG